jgi:D-alanyl-D-alanine carboxypeptidase (penicillin-binding protein 5/6)
MKKKGVNFLQTVLHHKLKILTLLLFALVIFFLPGQNFYQKTSSTAQAPPLREFPLDFEPAPYPLNFTQKPPPETTALSAVIIDLDSQAIIYQKNQETRLFPASTTKIMTALVALDYYQPQDILLVIRPDGIGRKMNLKVGEKISFQDLLYGLLVHSANDAAQTLAQNYPGGTNNFIDTMNLKARNLKLNATHFSNVSGVDTPNHYTTVSDLARLSTHALKNPIFKKIISTKEITVQSTDGRTKHRLENLNELLGKANGVTGVKTGWTEYAGECLVALTERDNRRIITVVLRSQDRFNDTQKLIDWVFENFRWENPL